MRTPKDLKQSKYHLDFQFDGPEVLDEGPWHKACYIVTEGDSLDECIDNAEVFYLDQDGGERCSTSAECERSINAIRLEFEAQFGLYIDEYLVEVWKGPKHLKSYTIWSTDYSAAYDLVESIYKDAGATGYRFTSMPKLVDL